MEAPEHGIDPIPEDGTVKGGITVIPAIGGSFSLAVGSKFPEIQAGQIPGDILCVYALYLRISVNTFFTGLQLKIALDVRLIRVYPERGRRISIFQVFWCIPIAEYAGPCIAEQVETFQAEAVIVLNRGCKPFHKPHGEGDSLQMLAVSIGYFLGVFSAKSYHRRIYNTRHPTAVIIVHKHMHHLMNDCPLELCEIRFFR